MSNEKQFEFLGIKKFHDAGYRGQGVIIASRESNISLHGMKVFDIINQIVPEASILTSANFRDELDCDIYTTSLFYASDKNEKSEVALQKLNKNSTFICCAIGNEAETSKTGMSNYDFITSVGACVLTDKNTVNRAYYSSISDRLDFMSLTNLYTTTGAKFTGTSCATPCFASMCALVQSFFIAKIGRKLTNDEMLRFVKDNCIDMKTEGKDKYSGWGLFILPDPETIDIQKYTGQVVVNLENATTSDDTENLIAEVEKESTALVSCECEHCGKLRSLLNKLLSIFKKKK